jgi:hypothetical protein
VARLLLEVPAHTGRLKDVSAAAAVRGKGGCRVQEALGLASGGLGRWRPDPRGRWLREEAAGLEAARRRRTRRFSSAGGLSIVGQPEHLHRCNMSSDVSTQLETYDSTGGAT